jgi:hypothetical protein
MAHDESADLGGFVRGTTLGLLVGTYFGLCLGVTLMAGRDKKLRAKGQPHEHPIARIALRVACKVDIDDLPEWWRVKVRTAALDKEDDGEEEMAKAAVQAHRYWEKRAEYAQEEEDG